MYLVYSSNYYEGMRGLSRDTLWLWSMEAENEGFRKEILQFKKKSLVKKQFYNNNFRKIVIYNAISDALHIYIINSMIKESFHYNSFKWNTKRFLEIKAGHLLWPIHCAFIITLDHTAFSKLKVVEKCII